MNHKRSFLLIVSVILIVALIYSTKVDQSSTMVTPEIQYTQEETPDIFVIPQKCKCGRQGHIAGTKQVQNGIKYTWICEKCFFAK